MFRRWVALTASLGIAVLVAAARTEPARAEARPETRPRLILNTNGPAALVRRIAFSSDSRAVYVAGEDKTVHVWRIEEAPGKPPQPVYVRTLRWEFSRGPRGWIYDIDASPGGGLLALGGYEGREGFGVAVVDLDKGAVSNRTAHEFWGAATIDAVSFSSDGQRLASIDKRGRVLVWSAAGFNQPWSPAEVRPAAASVFDERLTVRFLDDRHLAVPAPPQAGRSAGIEIYDVTRRSGRARPTGLFVDEPTLPNQQPQRLPQAGAEVGRPLVGNGNQVTALAVAGEGRWASAEADGAIFLWNGARPARPTAIRGTGQRVAVSLAFSQNGQQLLVGNQPDSADQTVVELWDVQNPARPQLLDQVATSQRPAVVHDTPVAWSRDGRWIALFRPVEQDVLVYRAAGAGQRTFASPAMQLRGNGQAVRRVAFENKPGSHVVGFANDAAAFPQQAWSPDDGRFHAAAARVPGWDAAGAWRSGADDAGGWTLNPVLDGRRPVGVSLARAPASATINLTPSKEGYYQSHCWIADGQGQTRAVALGTGFGNGIYVHRLPAAANGPAPRIRYFRDHNGAVNSLCVSADGRFLVSGSDDQTVKVWSLDAVNDPFPRCSWGADFVLRDGQLRIENVVPAGIMASRQFQSGDRIVRVQYADPTQPNGLKVETDAAAMRALFVTEGLVIRELQIAAEGTRGAAGELRQIGPAVVNPGWEPLVTFYAVRGGAEWAAFTPQGYYDASVVAGNELFGWQINQGPGTGPLVLKAANLQEQFEKPDLLRNLLAAGDLGGAFPLAGLDPPGDLHEQSAALVRSVPRISIIEPGLLEDFLGGKQLVLNAEVAFPQGTDPKDYDTSVFLNGRPIEVQSAVRENEAFLSGRNAEELTGGLNRLVVRVDSRAGGALGSRVSAESEVIVTSPVQAGEGAYPLYLLGVGVAKAYAAVPNGWPALQFADRDASEFAALVQQPRKGGGFDCKASELLLEGQVTQNAVDQAVKALAAKVRNAPFDPRALVVVFLSGHGTRVDDEYYLVAPACQKDEASVQALGVGWSRFEPLVNLPCQKLFIVDACRSGSIGDLRKAVNAVKRYGCAIVAASTSEADSFEDAANRHGVFTYCLLQGMKGENVDADFVQTSLEMLPADDTVTFGKLTQFLQQAVPTRAQRLSDAKFQIPSFYPEHLTYDPRLLWERKP